MPPVTATSAAVNVLDGSLRVKRSVAVRAERITGRSVAMATDGRTVSIVSGAASAPARFGLPIVSVKAPAATAIPPGMVESARGVKIAE